MINDIWVILGFACVTLAIVNGHKNKVAILAAQNNTKLLGTSLKEAELRLKEINAETELVTLELDSLRFNLEAEKEKLLASIGPKGDAIKELDKKIGELDRKIKEKQKKLDDFNARIESCSVDDNTLIYAHEIVEHILSVSGLTNSGSSCDHFKSNPQKLAALNWLIIEGYAYCFIAADEDILAYTLYPGRTKKSIQDFYKLVNNKKFAAPLVRS